VRGEDDAIDPFSIAHSSWTIRGLVVLDLFVVSLAFKVGVVVLRVLVGPTPGYRCLVRCRRGAGIYTLVARNLTVLA